MNIKKSNGSLQTFDPNKILKRIKDQSTGLDVNVEEVFKKAIQGVVEGMNTKEVDNLVAVSAADLIPNHPDYSYLASRIIITRQGKIIGRKPKDTDFLYDFFGIRSFFHKYSLRTENEEPLELPHMMYERIAKFFAKNKEEEKEFYYYLSQRLYTGATPILTNAGTKRQNFISCCLTSLIADETNAILSTLNDISLASRDGAGIGLHLHNLRSERSIVSSFNGTAGGVVRFADMVQSHMRFFKQGNRSGSAALYLGVWHRDIIEFLSLRLPTGDEKLRTRDLFTAVCLPDIFMEKLKAGEEYWYTFCPNDIVKAGLTPLHELWGDQFKEAYNKYVELGLGHPILIREIWDLMIRAQVEGGMPYTFFWDNANRENHQKHIGVITGSNLCVSGDSVLSTIDGERHIDDLVGQKVKIWNGEEFSESLVAKTGENKELYKVTVRVNGSELRSLKCTAEHKWYLMDYPTEKEYEVTTTDLSEGDTLTPYFDPNTLVRIFAKVISIDKLEGLHDTYCVNEPERHKAMFNGILTGNCIEITEVTKANYTAQCCLGSINLANNLSTETLIGSVRSLTKFLNRVIDKNEWATEGARIAGLDQRALAIGVSGMADHLAMKKMNYEDSASYQESIIETIYKAALNTSHELAIHEGIDLPCWKNSVYDTGGYQNTLLFSDYKVANSLFVGLMPTASTSALVGVNESFEPFESNLFVRSIDNGEFVLINKHLVRDLQELGLWNKEMIEDLKYYEGSVQQLDIPEDIKARYKTVWEMRPRKLLDCAIARQKWVDQSQSMNVYYADPQANTIGTALIYSWENGLKTGSYYTKTKSKLSKPKRLGQEKKTSTILPGGYQIDCFGCSS